LDREALQQSLAGTAVAEAEFRWIPSVGQLVLGFILPFALAFVGIPLESFVHSLRTVLGVVALGLLRALRLVLRIIGGIANHLSNMLVSLYDLFIMIPLAIERAVSSWRSNAAEKQSAASTEGSWEDFEEAEYPAATVTAQEAEPEPARKNPNPARNSTRSSTQNPADDTHFTPQEA